MTTKFRLGVCQMLVSASKEQNISKAVAMIGEARQKGAQMVVLPECFNSPYGTKYFGEYAEPTTPDGGTYQAMAQAAKDNKVWLIAGSIPERDGDKLYNTCMAFDPHGTMVGKYRKMHLFRLRTEQLTVDEGETLTGGDSPTVLDIKAGGPANMPMDFKVGLAICFDVRYPQLALHYSQKHGTSMLVYPSAFNTVTGPRYWRLVSQARAVDSQQFLVMASPARDVTAGYVAWGHSHLVDPYGDISESLDENEGILMQDVDLAMVGKVRQALPILSGTRNDLYEINFKQ